MISKTIMAGLGVISIFEKATATQVLQGHSIESEYESSETAKPATATKVQQGHSIESEYESSETAKPERVYTGTLEEHVSKHATNKNRNRAHSADQYTQPKTVTSSGRVIVRTQNTRRMSARDRISRKEVRPIQDRKNSVEPNVWVQYLQEKHKLTKRHWNEVTEMLDEAKANKRERIAEQLRFDMEKQKLLSEQEKFAKVKKYELGELQGRHNRYNERYDLLKKLQKEAKERKKQSYKVAAASAIGGSFGVLSVAAVVLPFLNEKIQNYDVVCYIAGGMIFLMGLCLIMMILKPGDWGKLKTLSMITSLFAGMGVGGTFITEQVLNVVESDAASDLSSKVLGVGIASTVGITLLMIMGILFMRFKPAAKYQIAMTGLALGGIAAGTGAMMMNIWSEQESMANVPECVIIAGCSVGAVAIVMAIFFFFGSKYAKNWHQKINIVVMTCGVVGTGVVGALVTMDYYEFGELTMTDNMLAASIVGGVAGLCLIATLIINLVRYCKNKNAQEAVDVQVRP